jgi:hypothetical protein
MKIIKAILILSMLGWYAHADIFTDAGDWVEGAVKDTEDVVESAFNSTTNWVSHNPGLAMGIAVIATTVVLGAARPKGIKWAGNKVAKPFRSGYYRLRGLATGASRGLAEAGESLELQETRMAVGGVEKENMVGKVRRRQDRQDMLDREERVRMYNQATGVDLKHELTKSTFLEEGMFEMDEVFSVNGVSVSKYNPIQDVDLEDMAFRMNASDVAGIEKFQQESSFILRDGELTRVRTKDLKPAPMSQAKTTALIAGLSAIIVGAGYAAYNIADKGLIWTKDAVAAAIGGIGDAACWLAYGNHEECDDFVMPDIVVGVNEDNETDNNSFFKPDLKIGEDFILDL